MPDWQLHRDADSGFSLAVRGVDGIAVRARAIIGEAGLIAASKSEKEIGPRRSDGGCCVISIFGRTRLVSRCVVFPKRRSRRNADGVMTRPAPLIIVM